MTASRDQGAALSGTGSRPSDQTPSGSDAPRVDPSRGPRWRQSEDGNALQLWTGGRAAAAEIHRWVDKTGETAWWTLEVRGEERGIIGTLAEAGRKACDVLGLPYVPLPADLLAEHGETDHAALAVQATDSPASEVSAFDGLVAFAREVDAVSRSGADTISFLVELNRLAKVAAALVARVDAGQASGTAARSAETSGLGPKGNGPAPQGDAR